MGEGEGKELEWDRKMKKKEVQQTAGGPRKIFNPNNEYCRSLPQSAFPVVFRDGQAWGAKKCRAAWHACACPGPQAGGEHAWRGCGGASHRLLRPALTSHELRAGHKQETAGDEGSESGRTLILPRAFLQDTGTSSPPSPSCRYPALTNAVSSSFRLLHHPELCELWNSMDSLVFVTWGVELAQQPAGAHEQRS